MGEWVEGSKVECGVKNIVYDSTALDLWAIKMERGVQNAEHDRATATELAQFVFLKPSFHFSIGIIHFVNNHLISYCLQTLHVFCVVRPTLLVPHLRSVQPYVRRGDAAAANTEQAVTGAAGFLFLGGSVCRYLLDYMQIFFERGHMSFNHSIDLSSMIGNHRMFPRHKTKRVWSPVQRLTYHYFRNL